MNRISRLTLAAAAGLIVALGAASAQAQVGPRQDVMKANAAAQRTLTPLIRGEQPWNKDVAVAQAKILADDAKKLATLFPAGSEGGNAKPEIWSNRADFDAKLKAFDDAAVKLVAANGEEAAFKAAFQPLGATCGACHQAYRKPLN